MAPKQECQSIVQSCGNSVVYGQLCLCVSDANAHHSARCQHEVLAKGRILGSTLAEDGFPFR
jgi:hypothetical protein